MANALIDAYVPLLGWIGAGILLFRLLPQDFPRLLGRSLYWVGVPLEILALTRRTQLSGSSSLVPAITAATLLTGFGIAWVVLKFVQWWEVPTTQQADLKNQITAELPFLPPNSSQGSIWHKPACQGGFLLSSVLGNTGFMGLAIVPVFVGDAALDWVVFYGVTQNIVGTYGLGVLLSSYYGRAVEGRPWWQPLQDVATVPSLWACALGFSTQAVPLPAIAETALQRSIWVVIPAAFLLIGLRLSQLRGLQSLKGAVLPTLLKVIILPALIGIGGLWLGISDDSLLTLVLMAGMPTAFAALILAEEYELDREMVTSSILLTTLVLLVMIPVWLFCFGDIAAIANS